MTGLDLRAHIFPPHGHHFRTGLTDLFTLKVTGRTCIYCNNPLVAHVCEPGGSRCDCCVPSHLDLRVSQKCLNMGCVVNGPFPQSRWPWIRWPWLHPLRRPVNGRNHLISPFNGLPSIHAPIYRICRFSDELTTSGVVNTGSIQSFLSHIVRIVSSLNLAGGHARQPG